MTLWALDKLHQNNLRFLNDSNWLKAFSEAHQKARRWVLSVQQGGGFEPPRGSGTAKRFEFDCDRKTYRIDIEIHGDKYADWFK